MNQPEPTEQELFDDAFGVLSEDSLMLLATAVPFRSKSPHFRRHNLGDLILIAFRALVVQREVSRQASIGHIH